MRHVHTQGSAPRRGTARRAQVIGRVIGPTVITGRRSLGDAMSASYWRARPPGGRGVLCAALVATCAVYPRYVGANDCAKVKALADCESTTMMGLEVVEGGGGLLTVTRASGEALGAGATYEPSEQLAARRMEEDAPPEEDDRDEGDAPARQELYRFKSSQIDMRWAPGPQSMAVDIEYDTAGWVGFAFSPDSTMLGPKGKNPAIVGADGVITGYLMSTKALGGMSQIDLSGCGVDLSGASVTTEDGKTRMRFGLMYSDSTDADCPGSPSSFVIERNSAPIRLIVAHGSSEEYGYHRERAAVCALSADGTSCDVAIFEYGWKLKLHGALMGLAWLFFAPLGTAISRYGRAKVGERWFRLHLGLMLSAFAFSIGGVAVAALMVPRQLETTHARQGAIFFLFLIFQPLTGFLRPAKTDPRRARWEALHKGYGGLLLVLGVQEVLIGAGASGAGAPLLGPLFAALMAWLGACGYLEWRRRRRVPRQSEASERVSERISSTEGLPQGWVEMRDTTTGRVYFYDEATRKSQWEAPFGAALPPPPESPRRALGNGSTSPPPPADEWHEHSDAETGCPFWHNPATNESTWVRPLSGEIAALDLSLPTPPSPRGRRPSSSTDDEANQIAT